MPNTGKTTSLATFVYGPYDYYDVDQQQAAIEYAGDKHMVIITCPGEKGVKSLHQTPNITSYYYETSETEAITDASWSRTALAEFNKLTKEVMLQKPDILVCDGFHSLWDHIMNRGTNGGYLNGDSIGSAGNPFESARLYSQTHNAFGQYITGLYDSKIPLIVATTWEDWQSGTTEQEAGKAQSPASTRYLWPAIPGKMAMAIVGKFDIRISARIEKRCCHPQCILTKESTEHFVWQFMNKGDVKGVGIKGLRRTNDLMKKYPFVHQNYHDLQRLIEACSDPGKISLQ